MSVGHGKFGLRRGRKPGRVPVAKGPNLRVPAARVPCRMALLVPVSVARWPTRMRWADRLPSSQRSVWHRMADPLARAAAASPPHVVPPAPRRPSRASRPARRYDDRYGTTLSSRERSRPPIPGADCANSAAAGIASTSRGRSGPEGPPAPEAVLGLRTWSAFAAAFRFAQALPKRAHGGESSACSRPLTPPLDTSARSRLASSACS